MSNAVPVAVITATLGLEATPEVLTSGLSASSSWPCRTDLMDCIMPGLCLPLCLLIFHHLHSHQQCRAVTCVVHCQTLCCIPKLLLLPVACSLSLTLSVLIELFAGSPQTSNAVRCFLTHVGTRRLQQTPWVPLLMLTQLITKMQTCTAQEAAATARPSYSNFWCTWMYLLMGTAGQHLRSNASGVICTTNAFFIGLAAP